MAQDNSQEKQTTMLITGGSKGIGLELAKMCLADHNNIRLIVGCRSLGRVVKYDSKKSNDELRKDPDYWECLGNDGKINGSWNDGKHTRKDILKLKFDEILKTSKYGQNNSVDFIELDINTGETSNNENDEKMDESYKNSRKSIDDSVKYIKEKYGSIDILVNNAGFAQKGPAFDFDVVTRTSAINYYGSAYITEAFLNNKLINSNNGRIIFTGSMAGSSAFGNSNQDVRNRFEEIVQNGSKSDLDEMMQIFANAVKKNKNDITHEKLKFAQSAYGMSKAGVAMYSRLLARDLTKDKVSIGIAAYCPGYCQSYMSSGGGQRTSKDGAKGLELLCFEQNLDGNNNGQFWQMNMDKNKYQLNHTPWKSYMRM